jgi:hypothetical protein
MVTSLYHFTRTKQFCIRPVCLILQSRLDVLRLPLNEETAMELQSSKIHIIFFTLLCTLKVLFCCVSYLMKECIKNWQLCNMIYLHFTAYCSVS